MNAHCLRDAVREIQMPEAMRERIVRRCTTQSGPAARRSGVRWVRPAAASVAALLCLTLAVPVLAAQVEPIYQLMYLVSPTVAQYFQPVRESDTDNGIRLEVVSAYLHGDTAEIYVTLQDLEGDRIDESTDLFDSYSIHCPFDSYARCDSVGYDEQTRTATFLITVTTMGQEEIPGGKITFSLKQILSRKKFYDGVEVPVDLSAVPEAEETMEADIAGGSGAALDEDSATVLVPGEADLTFPVEEAELTGLAFVDGLLHIQTAIPDRRTRDDHGYFYLVDEAGRERLCDGTIYFSAAEEGSETMEYMETVFAVTPEELAGCRLYTRFWTGALLTEGDWKVTFPLEQAQ